METELSQATLAVDDGTYVRALFRHGLNSQEIAEAMAVGNGTLADEAAIYDGLWDRKRSKAVPPQHVKPAPVTLRGAS